MTTVVNRSVEPCDEVIMRPSIWGNPFVIGRDGSRAQVIQKYKEWLPKQEWLMKLLPELKDKALGCCCKPKPCHGDVIADLVNNL